MATRRESVRVDADVSPFVRSMAGAAAATRAFARDLDAADGRMANIVQTGLALGPALVPIGAAAIPAIAGLTTQLGFAAAGAGVTALAFSGVGDSLKALNDYQLEPTADNFAKLTEEFGKIGPAGQEFTLFLQDIRPKLQQLQDVAQQGLLPGAQEGIEELLKVSEETERVIFTIGDTMGDLLADAGDNLNDDRWRQFFDYLNATARPTLEEMGRTFGNFFEGTTNMVMAFDPLTRMFSEGFLGMSQSFVQWSDNLSGSSSFAEFVDYIQTNGPRAGEALGAIGGALVEIVEAAAPVGSVALGAIEKLADVLGAIADSPVGPVLITAAAAIGTLGRSMALLRTVGLRGGESMLGKVFAPEKIKAGAASLTSVTTAADRARLSVTQLEAAEKKRAATARAGLAQAGKGAALIGGLAVATSGVAESSGLANTAILGLAGAIAGPWGAAAGVGIGLAMDLAAANNDLEDAIKQAAATSSSATIDLVAQARDMETVVEKQEAYAASIRETYNPTTSASVRDYWNTLSDAFTNSKKEGEEAVKAERDKYMAVKTSLADLYATLNQGDLSMLRATDEELTRFASNIAPAAARAGINLRESLESGVGLDKLAGAVREYNAEIDSASGKSRLVGEALRVLEGEMESNTTAAEMLSAALNNLFGVEMNQSAAADEAIRRLREMREAIEEVDGSLNSNGKNALDARDAIRSYTSAQLTKIEADAAATGSGKQAAKSLLELRDNIIGAAKAAGASKKDIDALVKSMGLTPENLETVITTPGVLNAKQQVEGLKRLYDLTPKEVKTLISEAGANPTKAKVRALAEQYDLTPKQVTTFLEAVDNASAKAKEVKKRADDVKGDYTATLRAEDQATGVISSVFRALTGLNGKTATTYINTVHRNTVINKVENQLNRANGGPVFGPGTKTSDSIPAYLSNGEYVIRAAAVDKYGMAMFDRLNAMTFANGGPVQRFHKGGPVDHDHADLTGGQKRENRELRKELRALRNRLGDVRDELKATRDEAKQHRTSVRDSLLGNPFQGSLAGFDSQVRFERQTMRGVRDDLKTLRKRGLDGALLQQLMESGNPHLIDQFAGLSRKEIADRERAFNRRGSLATDIGRQSAQAVYGKEVRQLSNAVDRLGRRIKDSRGDLHIHGKVITKDAVNEARKIQRKQRQAAQLARHR